MALDIFDVRLLAALQSQADLTHEQLAERAFLSRSQCSRRVQRLRDEGYIDRIVAVLDHDKLGLTLKAYMMVSLRSHVDDSTRAFDTLVEQSPEVLECSRVTGDADYLLKVVAADLKAFDDFVQTLLHSNLVASVRSSIVLRDVKRTTELPLPTK